MLFIKIINLISKTLVEYKILYFFKGTPVI
jgi:hypothetical protein